MTYSWNFGDFIKYIYSSTVWDLFRYHMYLNSGFRGVGGVSKCYALKYACAADFLLTRFILFSI